MRVVENVVCSVGMLNPRRDKPEGTCRGEDTDETCGQCTAKAYSEGYR